MVIKFFLSLVIKGLSYYILVLFLISFIISFYPTGRIVTSGTTVQGFETRFQEEASVGDVIIIFHPSLLKEEEGIIVNILSQRSLSLHRKYSSDISSTITYSIRKDSIILKHKAYLAAEAAAETADKKSLAAGVEGMEKEDSRSLTQDALSLQLQKKIESAKPTLTYRQKTGMWGYKTVTENVNREATGENLLDMRIKKTGRDKFCW